MKMIYCDHAATTPVDPAVVEAMKPYFHDIYGNPSSIHTAGQEAKQAMEHARGTIAASINADPEEIIFTSGGTESNNTVFKGLAFAKRRTGNHIIVSAIEHHSVTETCAFLEEQGFRVSRVTVDGTGFVDPAAVEAAITGETILVSVMHANNEIGTIQPIADIARIARNRGIHYHTDAVQTYGHIPLDVRGLGVHMLSASAHKLNGPKGVGFLYKRKGVNLTPLLHGGDQERRRRASTENVPGIVGFGKAAELAHASIGEESERLTILRDRLIESLLDRIPNTRLNGHPVMRLPANVNLSFEFIEGESLVLLLDRMGIACSTGSACSSSSLEPSHVLLAIGLPHEIAHGSVRFSLGKETTGEDIDYIVDTVPGIVQKLRAMSPLYHE